jgi:FKBP-type peptidyl-prolyl cis-trans isomerase
MRILLMVAAFVVAATSCTAQQGKTNLKTDEAKFGYALGFGYGEYLKQQSLDSLDIDAFIAGLIAGQKGDSSRVSEEDRERVFVAMTERIQVKMREKQREEMRASNDPKQAWLDENGKREGVVTTASGLQYEVITMGDGPKPAATDNVTVHYVGTLTNGTEFDSSLRRNEPITFPLNGVIAGWTEGVQLMPVGSKFKFYIPGYLGYGARGAGELIGPNETLVFEVELLDIQ